MRSFVETDEKSGLVSLFALKRVQEKYKKAIDLELCAFAQEGLTQKPKTRKLLEKALQIGASVIGGCPYKDKNPQEYSKQIFDLAEKYDIPVDFHLDFDLNPKNSSIPILVQETFNLNCEVRVGIGHVTNLSAKQPQSR